MAKRIVFTETGEVRTPRKGDWFLHDARPLFAYCDGSEAFTILTRTEEEVPDPPKPRQVVYVPKATLVPTDVHDTCFNIKGVNYYSVEVPTKAEAEKEDEAWDFGFIHGVRWLASKLGIKIE